MRGNGKMGVDRSSVSGEGLRDVKLFGKIGALLRFSNCCLCFERNGIL
jgi:hypothetical protein